MICLYKFHIIDIERTEWLFFKLLSRYNLNNIHFKNGKIFINPYIYLKLHLLQKNRGKPFSFPKGFPRSLPYLFINHHPTIPAFPIREVKELAAAVDDRLVERKAAYFQDFQQVVRTSNIAH